MKKQLLLGASFVAAVPSMAAAQPPAPAVPPLFTWAGPYIGFGGGAGWGHSDHSDIGIPCTLFGSCGTTLVPPLTASGTGAVSTSGGVYGGFAGYSLQFGQWVYGGELDYFGGHISGSSMSCGANASFPHACGTALNSVGTLRARIGYSLSNWLFYATGGWAFGRIHSWDNLIPSLGSSSPSGLAGGAGIQATLMRNWSFRVEYLFIDFGNHQFFEIVPGIGESTSLTVNLLRFGIVYSP